MRLLALLMAVLGGSGLLLAARMMALAQSPPIAYAAAVVGVAAIAALGVSLLIICLAAT